MTLFSDGSLLTTCRDDWGKEGGLPTDENGLRLPHVVKIMLGIAFAGEVLGPRASE